MRTIHTVAIAAAIAAAGVVGASVIHLAGAQDAPALAAGGDLAVAAEDTASEELRSVLATSETLNDGAVVSVDVSLPDAHAAGMIGGSPDGVVVEPAHCLTYLSNVLDAKVGVAGWLQMGVRPESEGHYSALLASVPGGVTPDDLLAGVRGCEAGTITVEKLGVTGEFSITAFEVPDEPGVQTLGLHVQTSFPENISDEQLAEELSCLASTQGAVTEASQACGDQRELSQAAAQQAMSFYSQEYFFVYAMSGDLMAEACEIERLGAIEVATELLQSASEQLA
jgi:hypothetical protein